MKYIKNTGLFVIIVTILFFNFTPSYAVQYYVSGGYISNNQNNQSSNSVLISVSSAGAINITSQGALLSGLLNGNNIYNNYSVSTWFEYGFTPSLGYYTNRNYPNNGYSSFSYTLTGLKEDTVYYFRAAAQSPQGVVYGGISAFRTSPSNIITPVNNLNGTTIITAPPIATPEKVASPKATSTATKNISTVAKVENPNTDTTIPTSFFPMTILGWMLLIILVLILILTIKHVHLKFAGKKTNDKLH